MARHVFAMTALCAALMAGAGLIGNAAAQDCPRGQLDKRDQSRGLLHARGRIAKKPTRRPRLGRSRRIRTSKHGGPALSRS